MCSAVLCCALIWSAVVLMFVCYAAFSYWRRNWNSIISKKDHSKSLAQISVWLCVPTWTPVRVVGRWKIFHAIQSDKLHTIYLIPFHRAYPIILHFSSFIFFQISLEYSFSQPNHHNCLRLKLTKRNSYVHLTFTFMKFFYNTLVLAGVFFSLNFGYFSLDVIIEREYTIFP